MKLKIELSSMALEFPLQLIYSRRKLKGNTLDKNVLQIENANT